MHVTPNKNCVTFFLDDILQLHQNPPRALAIAHWSVYELLERLLFTQNCHLILSTTLQNNEQNEKLLRQFAFDVLFHQIDFHSTHKNAQAITNTIQLHCRTTHIECKMTKTTDADSNCDENKHFNYNDTQKVLNAMLAHFNTPPAKTTAKSDKLNVISYDNWSNYQFIYPKTRCAPKKKRLDELTSMHMKASTPKTRTNRYAMTTKPPSQPTQWPLFN